MKSLAHKMTNQVAKTWKMDTSKITETNLQLLEKVGFPKELKLNPAGSLVIMKKISKRHVNHIFVEKEVLTVDDIIYQTTSRKVAAINIAKYDTTGKNDAETKAKKAHIQGVLSSQPQSIVYIDSVHAQEELEAFLSTFGEPEKTESMKDGDDKKEKVENVVKKEKVELTQEQESIIVEKYKSGAMSAEEIADFLGIKKVTVTNYIKSIQKP